MASTNESDLNVGAIENFVEYLQIPSVHPNVNYDGCLQFLRKQAQGLNLPMKVHYCFPNKPIVVITWQGNEPSSPSILLSSHMDVVPVYEVKWKYKPFSAHITEEGNIYARGSQDMKCVGIQYLEAVRRLRRDKVTLRRTIHLLFTPDEEIGGAEGMRAFVKTPEFRDLNVGFALDEGMASPTNEFVLFYGERCIWYIIIHCMGQPGHGSLLLKNTAGQKLQYLLSKVYEFRAQQEKKLESDSSLTIGDVMSINVTQIQGGVQPNVIPPEFTLVLDCRIPVTVDVVKWEETLNKWCTEAGDNVWIEYKQKLPQVPVTKLDHTNAYWAAFQEASNKLGIKIKTEIFTGGTDSRYLRGVGIPAFGFSPMNNTPVLLHDHNEYINQNIFLRGIEIYYEIIASVANVLDTTG
ncbi:hypothetical protein RI129_010770 [Pyrocoelia pectoralis]|uniref:N-acyl-aliphatic-L-amino acid amidohydrolase n=1 Tax=Pyrocoelia pectoralis TaxID=417401 RepID=A0AAN7V9X0_9COLE